MTKECLDSDCPYHNCHFEPDSGPFCDHEPCIIQYEKMLEYCDKLEEYANIDFKDGHKLLTMIFREYTDFSDDFYEAMCEEIIRIVKHYETNYDIQHKVRLIKKGLTNF